MKNYSFGVKQQSLTHYKSSSKIALYSDLNLFCKLQICITLLRFLRISLSPSLALFTHTPFPLTCAFYAFCYIISLNINTEELSRYVAKVVPVNEITNSKLSIFKIGKSECDINNVYIISMNINECVSCADDVNKHGDVQIKHRRLCRVKNMLAMYLKYHKAGLTPTTSVTSTTISSVKMAIGHKSLTNLRSEMIFLQGKPVFYIFLPSTPQY